MKSVFFVLTFIFSTTLIFSQEVITGGGIFQQPGKVKTKNKSADTLTIPFFSDFSTAKPFEDFEETNVSLATNQAIKAPSTGVALFDAVDSTGKFYASSYNQKITADSLISKPINLYYPNETTIYMSFFYEAQGLLDLPESSDSLVLQFYSPITEQWSTVWQATDYSNQEFKQILINITEEKYLQKGFRFRFYNIISMPTNDAPSLVGNCDQWFVDYIYINKNRTSSDTYKRDIAFMDPFNFKLGEYTTIPYKHYKNNYSQIENNITLNFKNNGDNTRDIDSIYIVFEDVDNNISNDTLFLGSNGIPSNTAYSIGLTDNDFKLEHSSNAEFIEYNLGIKLVTDSYDSTCNNIINTTKKLGVIYSFDDGTSENGYGLYGDGTLLSYVAQKYYTYETDEITGFQVYFNSTFKEEQPYYFYAVVWDYNPATGGPGNILYEQEGFDVNHNKLDTFQSFKFDTPVSVSDTFFIGWKKTTENIMNVGLDRNFDGKEKKYYTGLNGSWYQSTKSGVLMLRPVMGDFSILNEPEIITKDLSVLAYPNPVKNILNISVSNTDDFNEKDIQIFDLYGRLVFSDKFYSDYFNVDFSQFANGVYIMKIISESQQKTIKVIKN